MKRSTLAYLLVFTLAALSLAAALFFFTREGTQPVPFPSAEQIQAAKKQLAEMPAPKGVDPAAWSAGEIELKTPTALDRVIARFKDGTSEEAQNEIISRYDGQLLSSFEFSPYSKSILIPESNREGLANDPDVTEVQSDEPEEMTLAQTVPWSLPAMGVNGAWGKNVKGAGIKVAVIDTGIDVSNPDLFPAVDMPCSSSYYSGKGSLQYDTIAASIDDQFNGHGSHVAGIIAARDDGVGVVGVAPEARLCVIRVLDDRGRGTVDGLIWGIEQAIKAGVHVINVSSGIRSGRIELLAVVLKAIDRGIVFVAGAGNPESGTIMYPAKYPWVIAVTVVDQYDRRYTNYPSGPEIDFAAPGISIRSDCPPLSPICTEKNTAERTGVMSGSSMAAPFVAGQVALLLSQPINPIYDTNGDHTWQPSEVMEVLTASALNPATSYSQGKDDWYGYGILNTGAMLKTGAGTTFACTGSVPPNATLCSGADARIFQVSGILKDTGLLADTPVSLMGQCTGYGYCTYTCQTGFRLENGACAAPTPMGSLTPSTDSCVIASGESTCKAALTWTSSNTTSLSLVDTNTGTSLLAVTPTNQSLPFEVLVANPVTGFELRDGSTVLDRVEIAGDCVTGTRWNGNVCAPPPTVSNVTINDTSVIPDASTQYTITASASNSGGGSGIKSASVIINSEGVNKGAYRGLLAWSTGSLAGYTHQKTSCGADASAGSAGIYNGEWNSGAGKEYINLVRCTTAVSENTRTVSFAVTFNPNFTSPTSGNTLSGSVVSDGGTSAWKPFGTFSISAPAPAVCDAPLTKTVTVACDAREGYTVTGSVTRSQIKSAYPACAFGTPVTVDNSTYVPPDTCVYTPIPTGTWTAPVCPTACGTDASTPAYTCVGGNGQCAVNTPATRECLATEACAAPVCEAPLTREVSVSGVSCDLNAAGVAATSGSVTRKQTQTKSAYPACAFPASPDPASLTADDSTYVSDTCAYPPKVDGGWSAWSPASCPTTCGLDTSSQTRTCTSPVPSGGGAECTADGSSASRACDATPACACSAPLSQEVTVACDAREGFTVTGSVTRIQTKSAYPECAFQTSEYKSDTCEYTPIQCPSGEAYDAATASCVACGNGGCTGAGGTPTNPTGSLVCNNRSTETPAETETPSKTETPCIAPKKIVNGVCLLPASAPPTTPEISGLWRGSAYLGGTAPANYPDGYQLSARATSPSGLNLSYYFEWQTPGDTGAAQWSGWTGSGGWGSVTHYANYGAGTYYARAWAIDASDVWSLAPSAWTPFTLTAPGLSVSCAGSPGDPYIGQPVTWSATVTGGSGSYIYEWNGSDDLFDTVATVQKTYTTPGQKRATLAITDAESRKTASATCTGNVSGISDPTSPTTDVVVKSCTASLTATPSTVEQGLNTTLSWAVSDGALCASACAGSGFDTGGEISGSAPASTLPTPPTTSYTLTCTAGTYGPPAPANATVTVIIPEIIITVNGQTPGGTGGGGGGGGGGGTSLRVDPTKPNNVTLSWTPVNPSVGSCVVTKDTDPAWKKSGGSSGSVTDSITTQTTYTVDCTNKQGAHSTKSVVVNALVGYEEF